MNKSILIIDTPDCCINCDFLVFIKDYINLELRPSCSRSEIHLNKKDIYKKINKYCPLKPMPEKKNTSKLQDFGDSQIAWTDRTVYQNEGYNRCINEILGEE